jgi:tetratricopeptide (TPR) repeat protein
LIYDNFDYVKSIEYLHKAKSLYHGSQLPAILRDLGVAYHQVGFYEEAKYFTEEAFKLDKDSLKNYYSLGYLEHQLGNFAKFVESVEKINAIDSNYLGAQTYRDLGEEYMFLHQSDKSLNCFKKWLQKKEKTLTDQDFFGLHRVGWAYLKEGDKKEAEYYFNELIKYCEKVKELGRVSVDKLRPAYDLAGAYAVMGERVEAYENLRIWTKMAVCPLWWLTYLKYDPLFDSIRNETQFQKIVKEMEAKYQAEHERVKKWLEEQGML